MNLIVQREYNSRDSSASTDGLARRLGYLLNQPGHFTARDKAYCERSKLVHRTGNHKPASAIKCPQCFIHYLFVALFAAGKFLALAAVLDIFLSNTKSSRTERDDSYSR